MLVKKWLAQNGGLCFESSDAGGGSSADAGKGTGDASKTETAPVKSETDSRTFTQEELAKHAAEAQRKGKQIGINQFLEALRQEGIEVESIDDIKTRLAEDEKRRKSEMSEAEKLQKALEKAQADLKAKDDVITQTEQKARHDRRDSAVKAALRDANVRKDDADDAFILMRERGMLATLIGDDGELNTKAVDQAVATFKGDKPAYFAPTSPGSPSNTGGRTPAPDNAIKVPKIRL